MSARAVSSTQDRLLSRDFLLLFCQAMLCNVFIAVYYCLEQWLKAMQISPNQRGFLLAALFVAIFVCRPLASWFLLGKNKLWAMFLSIVVVNAVMLSYPFLAQEHLFASVFVLRLLQGTALAIYSCCTVSVLVECIPPGQSARGFALFSLTILLPYSIIPAVAEKILPFLGGEANLFAWTSVLALPSLLTLIPLAPRLRASTQNQAQTAGANRHMKRLIFASGLGLVYLACLMFSVMTGEAIFFIKGLCTLTDAQPAWFFTTYTSTIILVRLSGGKILDKLPRYTVIWLCCVLLALCMPGLAWGPLWTFIPLSCLYGVGLGLLYPMLAAVVYDRSLPATRSINSNLMMSSFDASGIFAPLLGGLIIHLGFGYRGVFASTAVAIVLCGLAMLCDWFFHGRILAKKMERKA